MPRYNIQPSWVSDVKQRAWGTVVTADNSSTTTDSWFYGMRGLIDKSVNAGQTFQNGVGSTYSLIYTSAGGAHSGGVLAPNGDIHFVPFAATVGQKISASGVVSTYSLVYSLPYSVGGVLAPNGDIHFIPT